MILLAGPFVVTPAIAQTEEKVDEAVETRNEASESLAAARLGLQAAVEEYQRLSGETYELEDRVGDLGVRINRNEDRLAAFGKSAQQLATEAYMAGSGSGIEIMLASSSIGELAAAQALMARANVEQASRWDRLAAVDGELKRLTRILNDDLETLAVRRAEAAETSDRLDELFHAVDAEYKVSVAAVGEAQQALDAENRRRAAEERRRKEEERKKRAGGGSQVGGLVCLSGPPLSFTNDWGFPRSGGRTHQGTDVFAAYGQPVYAVTSGVIRAREGGIGGITIWLNGDDGNGYYYAHLSGWAPNMTTGTRVAQGQEIGYTGDSGNAKGTPPHTHFQIHPGNGSPINPYPTLVGICD